MRVTITGASGLVGRRLVQALRERGDEVTVLSRSPDKTRAKLGVEAVAWQASDEPAPAAALAGRDAVIHLAGEPVSQRWNDEVKRRIHDSRVAGTQNLVAGLREAEDRPRVLVSASGVGYYGPHGDERVTESDPASDDFLGQLCVEWEGAADSARELGLRVAYVRTGIALDGKGGALKTMLPPFKLGVGGPIGSGAQYMPWIHIDDLVGIYLAAVDGDEWTGALNGSAPEPVTQKAFANALGRAVHRPAFMPVPKVALKLLMGEMAEIATTGVRAVPERPLALGYQFRHTDLDEALRSALDD
jgi:uncharacterized protein (TIGR01777 family)